MPWKLSRQRPGSRLARGQSPPRQQPVQSALQSDPRGNPTTPPLPLPIGIPESPFVPSQTYFDTTLKLPRPVTTISPNTFSELTFNPPKQMLNSPQVGRGFFLRRNTRRNPRWLRFFE